MLDWLVLSASENSSPGEGAGNADVAVPGVESNLPGEGAEKVELAVPGAGVGVTAGAAA